MGKNKKPWRQAAREKRQGVELVAALPAVEILPPPRDWSGEPPAVTIKLNPGRTHLVVTAPLLDGTLRDFAIKPERDGWDMLFGLLCRHQDHTRPGLEPVTPIVRTLWVSGTRVWFAPPTGIWDKAVFWPPGASRVSGTIRGAAPHSNTYGALEMVMVDFAMPPLRDGIPRMSTFTVPSKHLSHESGAPLITRGRREFTDADLAAL